ncbi:MAG: alpha/beta hydrolase, partial [Microvirga sp.]
MTFLAALLAGTSLVAAAAPAQQNPAPAAPRAAQEPSTLGEKAGRILDTITGKPQAKADTDMRRVLDTLADLKPEPIETLSAIDARQQPSATDAVKALLRKEGLSEMPEPGVATKDIVVRGAAGELKARTYMPEGAGGAGNLPVVVYFHGGGFVIGDLDAYDAGPRAIARQANALVVSVHYRQAPENKFPAAHEDAIAAYRWVVENARTLGGNPQQVAVMGESAGGNLAINVSLAARDQNVQPPVHEVLVYPLAGVDMNTPSYRENENAKPLDKPMIGWFVAQLTNGDGDKADPRLDIVGKAKLSNLPPTTIITAEIDPLRSEGMDLGRKLKAAGVAVNAKDYPGVTHEFFG